MAATEIDVSSDNADLPANISATQQQAGGVGQGYLVQVPDNLIGNGPSNPRNQYGSMYENRPLFDGRAVAWKRFDASFVHYIKDQREEDDLETSVFTPTRNRNIYSLLIRCIDDVSFDLISAAYKDKGQEAFLFLQEHFLGSAEKQKTDCMTEIGSLTLAENADVPKFVTKLFRLKEKSLHYRIFHPDGTEMLVVLAIRALPQRFQHYAVQLRGRKKYPTLEEFCRQLLKEDQVLKDLEMNKRKDSVLAVRAPVGGKRKRGRGRATTDPEVSHQAAAVGNYTARPNGNPGARQHGRPNTAARQHAPQPARASAPRQQQYSTANGSQRPPVTCTRCLSRSGHTQLECRSNRWCGNCNNASHDTNLCKKKQQ